MTNRILADFISLFFPRYCYACNDQLYSSEDCICLNCEHGLPKTNYHIESQNPVVVKMYGKAPIKFASSYLRFVKSGRTQRLLHQLKYRGKPDIGNILGKWYGKDLATKVKGLDINLIIPVPLHSEKRKKRGYNQSEGFAVGLSESLHIDTNMTVLERVKENTTQTKKSKLERWKNVEDIFKVTNTEVIAGMNILIVDDVITTGATLASCANEMLTKGAATISIVTIAVAEYS